MFMFNFYDYISYCLLQPSHLNSILPWKTDLHNGGFFHLHCHPCLPPLLTPLHHICTFILFFDSLTLIKYLLFFGPSLFIFWSVFSAVVGPVRGLNSAVSDMPVFGLAAGDGGWAGTGALSVSAILAALPSMCKLGLRASHTVAIHSPCTHRIEYGLFGGQWQCQECWALVPLWEKNSVWFTVALSPSLSLNICSSLMSGITRSISRPVSSFLQIPDQPVRGPPSQRNPKESQCPPHRYFLTQSYIPSGSFTVLAMKKQKATDRWLIKAKTT